jgi:hypothetical protein
MCIGEPEEPVDHVLHVIGIRADHPHHVFV